MSYEITLYLDDELAIQKVDIKQDQGDPTQAYKDDIIYGVKAADLRQFPYLSRYEPITLLGFSTDISGQNIEMLYVKAKNCSYYWV